MHTFSKFIFYEIYIRFFLEMEMENNRNLPNINFRHEEINNSHHIPNQLANNYYRETHSNQYTPDNHTNHDEINQQANRNSNENTFNQNQPNNQTYTPSIMDSFMSRPGVIIASLVLILPSFNRYMLITAFLFIQTLIGRILMEIIKLKVLIKHFYKLIYLY